MSSLRLSLSAATFFQCKLLHTAKDCAFLRSYPTGRFSLSIFTRRSSCAEFPSKRELITPVPNGAIRKYDAACCAYGTTTTAVLGGCRLQSNFSNARETGSLGKSWLARRHCKAASSQQATSERDDSLPKSEAAKLPSGEAGSTKDWLTIPTILTLARIVAIPALVAAFYSEPGWALGIFLAASVTDWLDGYIARKMKSTSEFGAFLDPVADKLMVSAALLLLCSEAPNVGGPPWVVVLPSLIIIGRELVMSALREWAATQGPSIRQALAVSAVGKWKTAAQMTSLIVLLALRDPSWTGPTAEIGSIAGISFLYIAAGLTAWSLGQYIRVLLASLPKL